MKIHSYFRKPISIAMALLLGGVVPTAILFSMRQASALDFLNRRLSLSTNLPSAVATQTITFDWVTTNNVGSLVFEYCDNTPLYDISCTAPAGFNASAATLSSQLLNTGFTVDVGNTNANRVVLTRSVAAGITGATSYTLGNIVNNSTPNQTVFLRLSTHASTDGTGARIDSGAFAFSTGISNFSVGVYVPPHLTFCVGVVVALDCSSTTGSLVTFGELSSSATRSTTTQFSTSTNDGTGYQVYLNGQTMTSGNNIINALASDATSSTGASQFGLNLRANSSPSVGAEVSGIGTGVAQAGYNTPNRFKFVDGDMVVRSTISSDYNRFTASYIVNVPDNQPPGVYATTLSYSAVVSF